jgi:alkylation response protein AidB-like acyl-CoA dehydrogenase
LTATDVIGATGSWLDELDGWLTANWDPDLTVAEWWERLGLAGWAAPSLPEGSYGRGLSRTDGLRVGQEISAKGALGAPAGLGLVLAAPTIVAHGTKGQVDTYVRDIVTGRRAWCQLFSEPSAGSDLAGLQTRAVRDGDEWTVNGQKVWTSGAHYADLGMLLARTDPEVPKHQGITYFALPMHQAGVEVRPLREMTGRALFNEVFMTDARASDDAVIGLVDHGWAVANTTLMNERAGLGAGGGSTLGVGAVPGTMAGHLERRAGDFTGPAGGRTGGGSKDGGPSRAGSGGGGGGGGGDGETGALRAMTRGAELMILLAKGSAAATDPSVRQDLARLHTLSELGRFNSLRLKAAKESGSDIPGMANIAKLAMSQMTNLSRDVGLRIIGPAGMLHAYDDAGRKALVEETGNPLTSMVTELALLSPAPSIYGGTDQIQRNIIGERVLGLPKDAGTERNTPFSELPKNA